MASLSPEFLAAWLDRAEVRVAIKLHLPPPKGGV